VEHAELDADARGVQGCTDADPAVLVDVDRGHVRATAGSVAHPLTISRRAVGSGWI